jgi:Holliday junction resolvasome RuvABC ATP-dependent DNA helicase subunit
MGKTTLARALAVKCGTRFHQIFASQSLRSRDICAELYEVDTGDVVLIDEAHAMSQHVQLFVHQVLDEWLAPKILDDGSLHRTEKMSVAKFTLILATNLPAGLSKALQSRLMPVPLDPYSKGEMNMLVTALCGEHQFEPTEGAAKLLARISAGSPRTTGLYLGGLRQFSPQGLRCCTSRRWSPDSSSWAS